MKEVSQGLFLTSKIEADLTQITLEHKTHKSQIRII